METNVEKIQSKSFNLPNTYSKFFENFFKPFASYSIFLNFNNASEFENKNFKTIIDNSTIIASVNNVYSIHLILEM